MHTPKITVFTATYNRGYIIENAYRSLQRQTISDFEWIVIDDGSTDDTEMKFKQWTQEKNLFSMIYQKVINAGKMRAVNKGLFLASGELFLNLDSDDYLTDDAIEIVVKWEKTIQNQKNKFAGVAGLRCHFDKSLIGTTFSGEYIDASVIERDKNGITGDRVEIFYTEIFRRHLFPEISGEKFISEGVTWMEICSEEKKVLRWFNEKIYMCEYRKDGYSNSCLKLLIDNPKGVCLNIKKKICYIKPNYFEKLKLWHCYFIIGKNLNYSRKKIISDLEITLFDYYAVLLGKFLLKMKRRKNETL